MTSRIFFLLLTWACTSSLIAQDRYVILIGNFLEPRVEDFAAIRPAGFIHAGPSEAGVARILLGGYNDQASAERALQFVHSQGYVYAYIQQLSATSGANIAVVQIGSEKSAEPISWSKYSTVGDLYAFMEGNEVKILTSPSTSVEEAKNKLQGIQQLGFKDAFVKLVNSAFVHKLGDFETGLKKPFIALPTSRSETASERPTPVSYEQKPVGQSPGASPSANPAQTSVKPAPPVLNSLPSIRGNVKRRSVSDLQSALKGVGYYNGPQDGLYGTGTATAYDKFRGQHTLAARYALRSEGVFQGEAAEFQRAIQALPDDSGAITVISSSSIPLARGYKAYLLFLRSGPSEEINRLMNSAIQEAFQSKTWAVAPPFDYRATYSYQSLDQLVLHLHFLHSASDIPFQASCQFPVSAMTRVTEAYSGVNQDAFPYRGCIPFSLWPEMATAESLAREIGANPKAAVPSAILQLNLYNAPAAPRPEEEVSLENWNLRLWKNLDAWAVTDPLHANYIRAFKVAYLQSLVRLEDHFMDKGFKPEPSRTLSLKTMQIAVGSYLQRFQ